MQPVPGDDGNHILHVDMSGKWHLKNEEAAIAYRSKQAPDCHEGCYIPKRLKKYLHEHLEIGTDTARIHAICLHQLLEGKLDHVSIIVVCEDERTVKVFPYLKQLFAEDPAYSNIEVISIVEYRRRTNFPTMESYADNITTSYRRNGKNPRKSPALTYFKLNIDKLCGSWYELQ